MIYILYSNDYEVFLGGNHLSEAEVLIDTTENVLSACEEVDVPMTLFSDLACLWRYRELGFTDFPERVDQQLKQALKRGHDVQTHIHPHWFEADIVRDDKGASAYHFDLAKFLLGNWQTKPGETLKSSYVGIFQRAKAYLEDLLTPIKSDYACVSYRAGGYGIQPNVDLIFEALIESGYTIDSSIVPGMVLDSNVNTIDFRGVPREGNYLIDPAQGIEMAADRGVFEIPVMALRKGEARGLLARAFLRKLMRYFNKPSKPKHPGYPIQVSGTAAPKKSILREVLTELKLIQNGSYMLELGTDVDLMLTATRSYIKRYNSEGSDLFFSVSCHSKSTHPELLSAFKKYHLELKSIYGEKIKAITFQQADQLLKSKKRMTQ